MFQGFTPAAVEFLWGICLNNERGWFMEHKQDYHDFVEKPIKELGREVFDALCEDFPNTDWQLHVCRIYRDARRLHGRGPYKDHMWFTIHRPHERFEPVPALYFEIAPSYFSYGCGFWDAGADIMAKHRARIDQRPGELEAIVRRLEHSRFVLGGEEYKRPKGDAGPLLNPWYNRKNLFLSFDDDPEGALFTPQLKEDILEGFHTLMPLYRYLDTLSGDPEPNKQ